MFKFFFLVNKQGQTRLAQYYDNTPADDRVVLEAEIVRKCLGRNEDKCSFFEMKGFNIIFRRYAALYFIAGVTVEENELAILEFIHNLVETFDKYFDSVCELDIMFNLDKAYMILDEMILDGEIFETNRSRVLAPVKQLERDMFSKTVS